MLDSEIDSINLVMDTVEAKVNSILEAIQALTKSMKDDRCGLTDITEGIESTEIDRSDEDTKNDELK